jgi:hypothetical protein
MGAIWGGRCPCCSDSQLERAQRFGNQCHIPTDARLGLYFPVICFRGPWRRMGTSWGGRCIYCSDSNLNELNALGTSVRHLRRTTWSLFPVICLRRPWRRMGAIWDGWCPCYSDSQLQRAQRFGNQCQIVTEARLVLYSQCSASVDHGDAWEPSGTFGGHVAQIPN